MEPCSRTGREMGAGAFCRIAFALIALGAWPAWAAANFPVGTHIVKGAVLGYDENGRNILLTSESGVTIRAVDTNGEIIAESKVIDATQDGVNFVLQIPLSKTATDSTCATGDQLNCVMVEASGMLISTEPFTVGGARESQTLTLKMIDVQRYVSEDGSKTNQVAQAYVDAIQAWMEDDEELDEQYRGKPYDPFADYDNDGLDHGVLDFAYARNRSAFLRIRWRARVRREHDDESHESDVAVAENPHERDGRGVCAGCAFGRP